MKKFLWILVLLAIVLMVIPPTIAKAAGQTQIEKIYASITAIPYDKPQTPNVSITVGGAVITVYPEWEDGVQNWKNGDRVTGYMELKAASGYIFSKNVKIVRTENEGMGDNVTATVERLSSSEVRLNFCYTVQLSSGSSTNGSTTIYPYNPDTETDQDQTTDYTWSYYDGYWYWTNGEENKTGWLYMDGRTYYLIPSKNGRMATGWRKINGDYYLFNKWDEGKYGCMITGWYKIGKDWYYMDSDGVMLTGWQTISGDKYYFEDGGEMAHDKWVGKYYLGSNGVARRNR